MNVTPFLLLKRSVADMVVQRANAALARWENDWTALPDNLLTCKALGSKAPLHNKTGEWRCYTLANGAMTWVAINSGMERSFEQMLFKHDEMDATCEKHLSSAVATDIARNALEDLAVTLMSEISGQAIVENPLASTEKNLPDLLFRPGSGAAICTLGFGDKEIFLALSAAALPKAAVQPKQSAQQPVATLLQAMAGVNVKLSVEVSQAELTLGYLRTLAVGDVLALPTSIDQTMLVRGPGGTTVCHAHLGTQMGFHAIELIKSTH